jgi:hypothetical protein
MVGASSSGLVFGAMAILLGFAAIAAAIRRRRGRDRYPETYAASGGIVYTLVASGCGVVLLLGGIGLIILTIIFKK